MNKQDYKNMWVYIEHDGSRAHSVGLELCCEIRKLCDVSGDKLFAVIVGTLPDVEIDKVKDCGVDGIINVSGENCEKYNTDVYANIFTVLSKKYMPSAIFVGGTINGRDFAPRFSVQLNTGCTSDAMELAYDSLHRTRCRRQDHGRYNCSRSAPTSWNDTPGNVQVCSHRQKKLY